jgi:hypothetical protein
MSAAAAETVAMDADPGRLSEGFSPAGHTDRARLRNIFRHSGL